MSKRQRSGSPSRAPQANLATVARKSASHALVHAGGQHHIVDHPPPARRLPPDNRAGLHSYYDDVPFEEEGHVLAVMVEAYMPTLYPLKAAADRDSACQDEFLDMFDNTQPLCNAIGGHVTVVDS